MIYLVLLGGPRAPRVVRIDGSVSSWLRPEERRLATIVQRALEEQERASSALEARRDGPFLVLRNGVAVADGGLDVVLSELPAETARVVLDVGGEDARMAPLPSGDVTIFVGDHLGLDEVTRAALARRTTISLGPTSLQAEDAIAIVHNELDRRASGAITGRS